MKCWVVSLVFSTAICSFLIRLLIERCRHGKENNVMVRSQFSLWEMFTGQSLLNYSAHNNYRTSDQPPGSLPRTIRLVTLVN